MSIRCLEKWEYITAEINRGRTLKSVGEDLNLSRERVRQIYVRATGNLHVPHPNKPGAPKITWTQEMDSLLGTMSDVNISKKIGVSLSLIKQRRRELGVPPYRKYLSLIGKVNGRLKVMGIERIHNGLIHLLCVCKCGETSLVTVGNFTHTKSCGCLAKEWCRKLGKSRRGVPRGKKLDSPLLNSR